MHPRFTNLELSTFGTILYYMALRPLMSSVTVEIKPMSTRIRVRILRSHLP